MVEDEKIDTAVKFYISAFGALVVNHFTDPDDHHVYELLLAGTKVSIFGIFEETSLGINAVF